MKVEESNNQGELKTKEKMNTIKEENFPSAVRIEFTTRKKCNAKSL